MASANDSITVTPGSGATVATHNPGDGKEYQVVVVADSSGDIGGNPRYRFISTSSTVGANKVHCDIFNAAGSGKVMRVRSVFVYVDYDTAVTGVVAVEVALTKTTTVGTGGTAAAADGTSITAPTITRLDSASPALPAQITARLTPAGGATAGAYLGSRWVFTEETNAGTAIAGASGADLIRNEGADAMIREGEGLRVIQGAVASVGAIAIEINFELI
jgi:hypothetical protein